MTGIDFITLSPQIVLLVWASLLLLADLFIPPTRKGITAVLAAAGLALALGLELSQIGQHSQAFHGMAVTDGFSVFLNVLFAISGLAGVAVAHDYLKRMDILRGEYYVLLLFSVAGMMLMASAGDLIMVFLALELLSIPLYILAGFAVPRPESEEAGLKYFLLGAFASGFVLYGTALIYGATGSTGLADISVAISGGRAVSGLLLAGAGLLLVGFGFKTALVPFHMWTPDVYQGAPAPVTAFMSVGAKAAGFAALLRIFTLIFPSFAANLSPVLAVLAGLTMLVGNIVAVTQTNIKRMLAYSSIAHAGYLLMAFVSFGDRAVLQNSVASVLFYLFSYALASLGAWAVVSAVETPDGSQNIADYAGLAKKSPALAASMAVFMLAFTGIPPLLGFWGKLYLFRTAIEGGYTWLAILGLLTSLVSAGYYLRVIVAMYMRPGEASASREFWVNLVPLVCALALIVIGLMPGKLFLWALASVLGG
jgi:NADH-quinone oxidoreductase subunit N